MNNMVDIKVRSDYPTYQENLYKYIKESNDLLTEQCRLASNFFGLEIINLRREFLNICLFDLMNQYSHITNDLLLNKHVSYDSAKEYLSKLHKIISFLIDTIMVVAKNVTFLNYFTFGIVDDINTTDYSSLHFNWSLLLPVDKYASDYDPLHKPSDIQPAQNINNPILSSLSNIARAIDIDSDFEDYSNQSAIADRIAYTIDKYIFNAVINKAKQEMSFDTVKSTKLFEHIQGVSATWRAISGRSFNINEYLLASYRQGANISRESYINFQPEFNNESNFLGYSRLLGKINNKSLAVLPDLEDDLILLGAKINTWDRNSKSAVVAFRHLFKLPLYGESQGIYLDMSINISNEYLRLINIK